MQSQQVDVAKRMKEVAAVMATPLAVLEEQGVTVEELEGAVQIYSWIMRWRTVTLLFFHLLFNPPPPFAFQFLNFCGRLMRIHTLLLPA